MGRSSVVGTKEKIKQELLSELHEMKKQGKHRAWFEEHYREFITEVWRESRDSEWESACLECLLDNQVPEYEDENFLQMILTGDSSLYISTYLVWYKREFINRRIIVNRGSAVGIQFLKEVFLGKWIEQNFKRDDLHIAFTMIMECVQVVGDEERLLELPKMEKVVLDLDNVDLMCACIKSGFLNANPDEYIEYALEKELFQQVPFLIAIKHGEKDKCMQF